MKKDTESTTKQGNEANTMLETAAGSQGKTIKTRKPHTCSYCDAEIKKGEQALYYEGKDARYENDEQVGIKFWKNWLHGNIEECRKNGAE